MPQMISYYLILAISAVESGLDETKINHEEHAYGVLQVTQPVLNDVNVHLKLHSTGFTLQDCLDPKIARIVFEQYMQIWATRERLHRAPTDEDIARIWNGGPDGHERLITLPYWEKVKIELTKYDHYYEYTEQP